MIESFDQPLIAFEVVVFLVRAGILFEPQMSIMNIFAEEPIFVSQVQN
jgi:hypothetical protein